MAYPWQDRSGTFAPIRGVALLVACLPALWLAYRAATSALGPRAFTAAIHDTGDWAVRLLLLTLLVSPARRLLNWPKLIGARQVLGLASFAYAALHIALYVADLKFDLARVGSEIIHRFYLGIGSMAFIGLLILAVNSGERAVRRLGGAEWTQLHKLVHPITVLMLLHFFLQSKLDVSQPLLMSGFALWLFGFRWLRKEWQTAPLPLSALAVAAAIGTQITELAWYGLATRTSASSIAEGIFDFDYEIRMMWYVLGVALLIATTPWLVRILPRQPR